MTPAAWGLAGRQLGLRAPPTNILSRSHLRVRKHTDVESARIYFEESSMASTVWNIIKRRMPQQVVDDFDENMARIILRRMDGGVAGNEYSLWSPDQRKGFRFTLPEAVPCSIGCAMNYARFPHVEKGANTYVCAIATISTADPDTSGNFFVA
ncbi:hypothetical protein CLAIMM_12753 [Cladophialophora immunda]|nr:hypothetical protein CLAIMM_12753 [Cladophialophora immunda]